MQFQRSRRACVQQFQGINIYKEEESETTCTMESDDDTSDDDDADESSIQEDMDNDKCNKTRPTSNENTDNKSALEPQTKGNFLMIDVLDQICNCFKYMSKFIISNVL